MLSLAKSQISSCFFWLGMIFVCIFAVCIENAAFQVFICFLAMGRILSCKVESLCILHLQRNHTSAYKKTDQKRNSRFLYRAHNYNVSNCAMIHHQID